MADNLLSDSLYTSLPQHLMRWHALGTGLRFWITYDAASLFKLVEGSTPSQPIKRELDCFPIRLTNNFVSNLSFK